MNTRLPMVAGLALVAAFACLAPGADAAPGASSPNIVLMMSDDQGWGETGYNGHPHLKTPVLDEMARGGLRLDRFYAASPVCTPTRASVMTGRHANRCGAFVFHYTIRPAEVTLAEIMHSAGYRTAHFGKWHIGAIKKDSPLSPVNKGFDHFIGHDNFFEMDPPLSINGEEPVVFQGEGSEVLVDEALKFVRAASNEGKPFFVVIWFGSPHNPYSGLEQDMALYHDLGSPIDARFAEITAMDRAIGKFRKGLDEIHARDNTLLWFNSDNGANKGSIPQEQMQHLFNGGLRDWKGGELYEGSLLVPGVIEWPAVIKTPRSSSLPIVTSDILPTVIDLIGVKHPKPKRPLDGESLKRLIVDGTMTERASPIGFWFYDTAGEKQNGDWLPRQELNRMITKIEPMFPGHVVPDVSYFHNYKHPHQKQKFTGRAAWTDSRYKLYVTGGGDKLELYDLQQDRGETKDIAKQHPQIVTRMKSELDRWQRSVERSLTGADYSQ
ncbi:MAG: sulfatase-like hydrolase/transferase [Pirellulales bacterium]|nr:sulfatase-like hydrolase/transferase [Pirellulales bacterium]